MTDRHDQRALRASTLSLVAALACIALFLPPLATQTLASPLRTAAAGAALGATLVLHWVFLAIGARRKTRSVAGWVGLSLLLFPVGSAAALMLLGWLDNESGAPAPAAAG